MAARGALIVLEGVDRCGKTSQTMKLVESLVKKNISAVRISFPDRATSTGKTIAKYLSDKDCKLSDQAIHLLFSANRWEKAGKMIEMLNKGVTLVVDRYSYSGIAFSVAKGMDYNWCSQPENGLPKPDLVLFLDINQESQKNRADFGSERYETPAMQEKVAKVFQTFASSEENWHVIDANYSFDHVHNALLQLIEKKVHNIAKLKPPLQYFTDFNDKENLKNGVHPNLVGNGFLN